MNAFVSEAQCAAMEHLADQGGVARYGHRPLTKATAMALGREGLVSITGYQVSLTLSGLRMYPPQGAGLVLSERERSVIAHLARQGGSARYGPRPLTGAIALLLRRTGLVLVTGSEVTLSERGRQLYRPLRKGPSVFDTSTLVPGERVYRLYDNGLSGDVQPLTVIRVNRRTVTVRTDEGSTFRLDKPLVEGRVHWPEDDHPGRDGKDEP